MLQFFADQIDQMDLALDQLSVRDRNFTRFALMLIDNVIELTLHKHAEDVSRENSLYQKYRASGPLYLDPKTVAAALGHHFDSKVKLARSTGFLNNDASDSIQYLHTFRNAAYHRGLRHEAILHSLALFYFKNVCSALENYNPFWWSISSTDKISHRATKYLGNGADKEDVKAACKRLRQVAESMKTSLILDLHNDMDKTIKDVDSQIQFLADNALTGKKSRKEIFGVGSKVPKSTIEGCLKWIASTYKVSTKTDPIPGWRKRLSSLGSEKNPHCALKKYCEFMKQTEKLRTIIDDSAAQLEGHIQHLIDVARGK